MDAEVLETFARSHVLGRGLVPALGLGLGLGLGLWLALGLGLGFGLALGLGFGLVAASYLCQQNGIYIYIYIYRMSLPILYGIWAARRDVQESGGEGISQHQAQVQNRDSSGAACAQRQ